MNAADIESFLNEEAVKLGAAVGQGYVSITVEVFAGGEIKWTTYAHQGEHRYAKTMEEAIMRQLVEQAPERRAAALRAKAKSLLAEAQALEVAK